MSGEKGGVVLLLSLDAYKEGVEDIYTDCNMQAKFFAIRSPK